MKQSEDINDTLRKDGVDGVRTKHDRAKRFNSEADRPVVEIVGDRLVKNIEATEAAIIADSGAPIFQRGQMLVRIVRLPRAESQDGIRRSANAPTICAVRHSTTRRRF